MTKKEMIKEIQVAEAQAWKAFRDAEVEGMGYSKEQIDRLKNKWVALYDLRESLGIPALSFGTMYAMNLVPLTQQVPRVA